MTWLLRSPASARVFLGFGVLVALVAAVIASGFGGLSALQDAQTRLYEREFQNAVDLKDIRSNQNAIRAAIFIMLVQPSELDAQLQDLRARVAENTRTFNELVDRNRTDSSLSARIDELKELQAAFQQTVEAETIPLLTAGRTEEARVVALGVQAQRNQQMRAIADELVEQADRSARAAVVRGSEQAVDVTRRFIIIGVLALILVVGLAGMFQRMVGSLRTVTREITEGVTVLSSSASEILATTSQVAASATETATSVSETTTTVEEVRQTSQLATQKAGQLSDSAQRSLSVSQSGTQAVQDAIDGMRRVQQQMDALAASILQLSEQSQSIGEIIATVSALAEQSNLLAVNAAIEAAKAGEAGRGFAVVASEVKALAGQSRQATTQVRSILGDIQRATSSAVLATEQGTKAAEAGLRQSNEAGEAIGLLAAAIAEAAQAAAQIAATAQQQMAGMDQVALAMEAINQASSQNVASTRQSERAAQDLHDLGAKLRDLVTQYRV
jgi:methyl-accepting chemotaxis protein